MGRGEGTLIVGAGPAGWAAAVAAREAGFEVEVVAPEPYAQFSATYCAWEDEVPAPWRDVVRDRWPDVRARFVAQDGLRLERPYVCLDNEAFRRRMMERASATITEGRVTECRFADDGVLVHLDDGSERKTHYVVDCTGSASPLVRWGPGAQPAVQTALGVVLRVPEGRTLPAVLMDYEPVQRPNGDPPSFGYVLPFSDGTVLIEETVLAARPPIDPSHLETRLQERVARYGAADWTVVDRETVYIPMGGPLPLAEQAVIPFGAAASMVHPATGYLVGQVLRRAPDLGRALAANRRVRRAEERMIRVNRAVWSRGLRATRRLFDAGLEILLALGPERVPHFFEAFFRAPRWAWSAYLQADAAPWRVSAAMLAAFRQMDTDDRSLVWKQVVESA